MVSGILKYRIDALFECSTFDISCFINYLELNIFNIVSIVAGMLDKQVNLLRHWKVFTSSL